jgi:hypothetical protein
MRPEPRVVRLHVRWQGGEIETLRVQLPPKRADAVRYPSPFVERIRQLAVEHHDDEPAALSGSHPKAPALPGDTYFAA